MTSDLAIVHRWRARLAIRTALLAVARKRYIWHPTDRNRAILATRRLQVAEAERVIIRHHGSTELAQKVSVADRAAAMIASYEGGQGSDGLFHPYWDQYGNVWTIGYGHTEGVSKTSRALTKVQAQALLADDLRRKYMPPVLLLNLPDDNKKVAVIDAVYNLGVGVITTQHSFGRALHARDWKTAAAVLVQYDHDANGNVLAGLLARRQAEARLLLVG